MHSTTKYIGGHSDTMGGVVITENPEIHEYLLETQKKIGSFVTI